MPASQPNAMLGRTFHSQCALQMKGDVKLLILRLNHAALEELHEFGTTPVPSWHSDHFTSQFQLLVINGIRTLGFGTLWCTGKGFWRAFSRLGGESRINLLLTVAKFDRDGNNIISDAEVVAYEKTTAELIASVSSALGSLAVIFTLLIGGTHQNTIGRPIP